MTTKRVNILKACMVALFSGGLTFFILYLTVGQAAQNLGHSGINMLALIPYAFSITLAVTLGSWSFNCFSTSSKVKIPAETKQKTGC